MFQVIKIEEANYKKYCNLDIVAFSCAKGGACGDGGGVCIIDANGQIYYTNYIRNIEYDHLLEVVPILKDCTFKLFDHEAPKGWISIYTGLGNHLTIKSIYNEPFKAEMEKRGITDPCYLFQRWSGMILTILNQTHSDVTMNQIWKELKREDGTIDE